MKKVFFTLLMTICVCFGYADICDSVSNDIFSTIDLLNAKQKELKSSVDSLDNIANKAFKESQKF